MNDFLFRILSIITFSLLLTGTVYSEGFTVIASGEIHGNISSGSGGIARIKRLCDSIGTHRSTLLLDAGGFAAGGIYDSYTGGRVYDSLRTEAAVRAMSEAGYDAVAVGDEELIYGLEPLLESAHRAGLPLVSANIDIDSKDIGSLQRFRVFEIHGRRVAVTGITTDERILDIPSDIGITPPLKALADVREEMLDTADTYILISHTGKGVLSGIKDVFPELSLIVNGHRKESSLPVIYKDNIPVMQFGFRGMRLSYFRGFKELKPYEIPEFGWYEVGDSTKEDSVVKGVHSEVVEKSKAKDLSVYKLFIMSMCPYGIPALKEMVSLTDVFPDAVLDVAFIGNINDDSTLSSLHGDKEIEEEKLWLAVEACYPEYYMEFLRIVTLPDCDAETAVSDMDLDTAELYEWVEENGERALTTDYAASERLDVNASPVLMLDNRLLQRVVFNRKGLANEMCSYTDTENQPPVCDSLPECFKDSDCKKEGMIGTCSSGECSFEKAVDFNIRVLVPYEEFYERHTGMLEDIFPGANVNRVFPESETGRSLIREYSPEFYPFYHIEDKIEKSRYFKNVERILDESKQGYTVNQMYIDRKYLYNREESNGSMVLYINPMFENIGDVLRTVFQFDRDIDILPVCFKDMSPEKRFSEEEALRWLIIRKHFSEYYDRYLKLYSKTPHTSFWLRNIEEAGINPDEFMEVFEGSSSGILNSHIKKVVDLGIDTPVSLLINNTELVSVGSPEMFFRIMGE